MTMPTTPAAVADELERHIHWLSRMADLDMEDIAADGGVTVAMVVQQEARTVQLPRLERALTALRAERGDGWRTMGREDDSALLAALERFTNEQGHVPRPIIDQWGRTVGTDYATPADLSFVEAVKDGMNGTIWTPPTADAYFRVCKALDRAKSELAALKKEG